MTCSGKFLRPNVDLPEEPSLKKVEVFPCNAEIGWKEAGYVLVGEDQFTKGLYYCMTKESLENLLENLVSMTIYNMELKVLLESLIEEEE